MTDKIIETPWWLPPDDEDGVDDAPQPEGPRTGARFMCILCGGAPTHESSACPVCGSPRVPLSEPEPEPQVVPEPKPKAQRKRKAKPPPEADPEPEANVGKVVRLVAARRPQNDDGSREFPFREKGANVLEGVFAALEIEVRWNLRARACEFRDTAEEPAPKWIAATDRATAHIRERVAGRFWYKARTSPEASALRFSRESWTDGLDALCYSRETDPFLDWLTDLPEWDQVPRLEFIFSDVFGAPDDALTRFAGRAPFVGAVVRALHPGAKIDESPVLISEQGFGKSAFVRSMFPPEFADQWSGDALDFRSSQKEMAETLAGRVVCEIAELTGLRQAEIEGVKSFLSRVNDGQNRGAYARASEPSPRRCVFVGSSNDPAPLANDESGNRRLICIVLAHGCNIEEVADENRLQWWSEAVELQRAGDDGRLPRALIPQQTIRAAQHRNRDEHLEDLLLSLPVGSPLTITEVHEAIDGRMKQVVSDHRLGRALKANGWSKVLEREDGKPRRKWIPPPQN